MFQRIVVCAAVGLWVGVLAAAEFVEEKYDDGTLKAKYSIDEQKRKDGPATEYHPNGEVKRKANYKAGKLDGPSTSYYVTGKLRLTTNYKAGKRDGFYSEHNADGGKKLTAVYRAGQLNGQLVLFEKGKPAFSQLFKDGEPVYPKTREQIKKTLAELLTADSKKDSDAALRRLKAYRFLCGVPYEKLTLDDDLNELAAAAAGICNKLKTLDHKPRNPGLPEEEYKLAFKGASRSNLGFNYGGLANSVDGWMDDTDDGEVPNLGHRRWCLNPKMGKTGFGTSGKYTAMYVFDQSQTSVPDFDFVSYPPRGLMPVEFFKGSYAWNVSLNPDKWRVAADDVKVTVTEVDATFQPVSEPLKLSYAEVNNMPFGLPECVIFKPQKFRVTAGKRYLVDVSGLTRRDGQPGSLRFPVEFMTLK